MAAEKIEETPTSLYQKFRSWSLRNQRMISIVFLASVLLTLLAGLPGGSDRSGLKDFVRAYFSGFRDQSTSDWEYSIQDAQITGDHLRAAYGALTTLHSDAATARLRIQDPEEYARFVRRRYETDLLALAALEDGVLNDTEARLVLEHAFLTAIADFYVRKRSGMPGGAYSVPEESDVRSIYDSHRGVYASMGLDRTAALRMIRATLSRLQMERQSAELDVARHVLVEQLDERLGVQFSGTGDGQ
ncbi:MAG: hypothetical protein H7A21_00620 [Spirochaetales bacterium]|nr:hypothetical protein [Leptospiraceae bacterium]MCP5479913.1 hypothetical protein [Spirochaetales bacterium]MCP5486652.1 hypothetical protein [Spirochaetales bacterium]